MKMTGSRKKKIERIPEGDVATAGFDYAHTIFPEPGVEVDVLKPSIQDFPYEIRVTLREHEGLMVFDAIGLYTEAGSEIDVGGPNGGMVDREIMEVTLWEAAEKTSHLTSYVYGRSPSCARNARGVKQLVPEHPSEPSM